MQNAGNFDFLLIGELSSNTGASPKTIRFYEREGLIVPPRHGRFRVYSRDDEKRLKAILEMRKMGLPIAQIRSILGKPASGEFVNPMESEHFSKVLTEHLKHLTDRHNEIKQQIEAVMTVLGDAKLANAI